jgi:hypothetical protein
VNYLAALNLLAPSKDKLPQAKPNTIQILMTDTFIILGALAFLMLVISGFRYILARGSPEKITSARNNIMYALIGLIIAALAGTIVNIVIGRAG